MKLYLPDGDGGYKEVEIEGETCVINIENIIEDQTPSYELPTMSQTLKGGAMVGIGLYMTGNTLNATPYFLPTMNESVKGGAKVGDGLCMVNDQLNLLPMSESIRGGAKVGKGLYMIGESLNAEPVPTMSESVKGGAKVGKGLYMEDDVLNVKLGEGFSVDDDGEIEFDPLKKIPLGDGLGLDDDGNLVFDPVEAFPSLSPGLGFDDGVLTVNPFVPITLGPGFSVDGGELTFDPLEVMPLGEGLTLSPGGALAVDPAIIPSAGDTVVVENPYELPTMSETLKGGAKVGIGLYMTGDTLNAATAPSTEEIFNAILNAKGESEQAQMIGTSIDWGDNEVYDSQHRRIGIVIPPIDYPPNWQDEVPPLTFAIPDKEPPYCVAYGLSSWAGGGLLILSEEWYYRNFKFYGDDDEELFTTNEQTYASGWFPGDTSDSLVNIEGDGHTLVEEENIVESNTNIAETKQLINGQTIIRITRYTFRHHLQQNSIKAKWHSEEQLSICSFGGAVHVELPGISTRGSIMYVINEAKLYLYDGEKWLPFAGGQTEQAEQGEESG